MPHIGEWPASEYFFRNSSASASIAASFVVGQFEATITQMIDDQLYVAAAEADGVDMSDETLQAYSPERPDNEELWITDISWRDEETTALLVVSDGGFGKRTALREYRRQGRAGYGVLIPFIIGGMMLQVLLHLWRMAVNR